MQVLIAFYELDELSGAVTYCLTVAEQLQRLGHEVVLHAPDDASPAEEARRRGLRVAATATELPDPGGVVYAQDGASAYAMAALWPDVPQVFCVHSDDWDLSLPPQVVGVAAAVVALHGRAEARARASAVAPEVVRLTQPVDVRLHRGLVPVGDPPRRALLLSSYVDGARAEQVREACRRAGLELHCVGRPFGNSTPATAELYNRYDIVLGKARVVLEAMACERAVYVYDANGGDGWVTPERYPVLERDNFGGQAETTATTVESLAAALAAADPAMGPANRDLVVAGHAAHRHAAALADLFGRVARGVPGPGRGPWLELARLARLQWDTDRLVGAIAEREALRAEATALHARVAELHAEVDRVHAEHASVRADRDALRAKLAAAERERSAG